MRSVGVRSASALVLILFLGMLTGCTFFGMQPETPPGPAVPRIANLQFNPDVINAGESTRMSFYYEVGSADLQEGFIIERGISQFQLFQALQPIVVDLREYDGQVAGTAQVQLNWSTVGIRLLELYVVSRKGNASNRITGTLTVR
jgi:hypothetical protein